ncbi:hypothetical protein DAPPUDRAFT_326149 [Daphnia pulex]|uniref:Uncharacterized protein n=1 Tax=Daphnia pulex TaxID=6669 RepID=E9H6Z8_DAPPU|nr:hypothetical protein DAPPUDRAFT_326149 [Daphnia pulex]|eukprot:EFX72426.1 hypothetical protein DAPPUDRAFT_326149 [Daphnia pulex]
MATQRCYSWIANAAQITLNKLSSVEESDDSEDIPQHHLKFTKLEGCVESGKATVKMWNETAEKFTVDISNLDDAIVVFCGFKVSAFAWDTGEIFLDKFDDSFKLNKISPATLFSGICFLACGFLISDQPGPTG